MTLGDQGLSAMAMCFKLGDSVMCVFAASVPLAKPVGDFHSCGHTADTHTIICNKPLAWDRYSVDS